ncbi:hypothetical protein HXX76_006217 [Chlamydomonas incerta]|uniref:RING-type domain-containing protein n=1 Tax=Chlamydomonas incerta TaxID=51695 RepID=A0A835T0Q2_CHLIN|nr:hypothetical protein HXX76_006217 [Chlamydomonas incerta]|eukprot:KAG2436689.1 hypothetical protein HXX76_006217 [Chlamydomonas incerta]
MALVALPTISSRAVDHEGFVVSQNHGAPEYHWIRIRGVDAATGSTANAVLQVAPSLEALLTGPGSSSGGFGAAAASGALGAVMARLRSAPSLDCFMSDLQEVLERLSYATSAGPGLADSRPGGAAAAAAAGPASAGASSRLVGLLLADLDALGWGCLEDLDQDAARLSLRLRDGCGRDHQLRLALPPDYPASPPAAATDLPLPLAFAWAPPAPPSAPGAQYPQHPHQRGAGAGGAGAGGGGGGDGCSCSSLVDVYRAFEQAVQRCQLLWECLDDIDRAARVLDPPPTVSAARRHLGPPARRLALGGAASLQLRLDPADPRGPPPLQGGGVAFLGPPEQVEGPRAAFFDRLHLWTRDRSPVENLELLLGKPLPPPAAAGAAAGEAGGCGSQQGGCQVPGDSHAVEAAAECPICLMHLLPVGDGGAAAAEEADDVDMAGDEAGDGAGGVGLVPDVECPTPACGLAFHTPCLAEWLRSVPDTRVSFNKLFGRCPFCSNPITVRA